VTVCCDRARFASPGGCGDEGSKPKPCDGGDDPAAKLATVLALHADPGLPWSAQLDAALVKFVAEHGATDWVSIRSARACRQALPFGV